VAKLKELQDKIQSMTFLQQVQENKQAVIKEQNASELEGLNKEIGLLRAAVKKLEKELAEKQKLIEQIQVLVDEQELLVKDKDKQIGEVKT